MERRRLGRTGQWSTVCIFGAAALWEVGAAEAEATLDLVLDHGVNHFDVAPSYGQAEERIGPWLQRHRDRVYLACKTLERTRQGAWDELHRSLKTLRTDYFDLYQLHAVREPAELDQVLAPGGAYEALQEARQRGLIRGIGITGHGYQAPAVHADALRRADFDTIMTPYNFIQAAVPAFRGNFKALLELAASRDVGLMIIKSVTRGPWGDQPKRYDTWYEPFDQSEAIERCVRFVLSHAVTALATPGDRKLLPLVLEAGQAFRSMPAEEQEALVTSASGFAPLFPSSESPPQQVL